MTASPVEMLTKESPTVGVIPRPSLIAQMICWHSLPPNVEPALDLLLVLGLAVLGLAVLGRPP